jgi:hypothetical protein
MSDAVCHEVELGEVFKTFYASKPQCLLLLFKARSAANAFPYFCEPIGYGNRPEQELLSTDNSQQLTKSFNII